MMEMSKAGGEVGICNSMLAPLQTERSRRGLSKLWVGPGQAATCLCKCSFVGRGTRIHVGCVYIYSLTTPRVRSCLCNDYLLFGPEPKNFANLCSRGKFAYSFTVIRAVVIFMCQSYRRALYAS